jgi:hypothetical protein
MLLDPSHPLLDEMGGTYGARLASRVPEAQRLMAAARTEAVSAKAGNLDDFRAGTAAVNAADAAAKGGQSLSALRKYVEARALFARARRSVR